MRKVSVGLVADVAGFVRDVDKAKGSVDDLGDEVKKLDRELDKIPVDATKAGAALKLLDGDAKSVGKTVNDLGEKNTGLTLLDIKIREAQKDVRKLGEEFLKTGEIDVFRKLGDAEGRLRGLRDVRKKLADALVPDAEDLKTVFGRLSNVASQAGTEFGKMFSGGITGALSTPVLGPIIGAALLAAVGAAATVVLSGAGGAILAGGALGGVGLGIIGAIMGDPKGIGDAWKREIADIKGDLIDASTAFRGPLIDAAHQFGGVFRDIHLEQILAKAATFLPLLVAGTAGFVRYLGQGLGVLFDSSGPAFKVLATELPKIGFAIKEAFAAIGANGEGGAAALKDILQITERIIVALGDLIGKAEAAYEKLAKFRDLVLPRDWLFTPDVPLTLQGTARALDSVGASAMTAAGGAVEFGHAIDDVRSKQLAAANASLALREGWITLDKELRVGQRVLGDNSQAALDNEQALLSQLEMAERARAQTLDLTGSQVEANKVYADAVDKIRATAYALGFNKQQVDALIDSVSGLPPTRTVEIRTPGMAQALDDGISLGNALNNIRGSYEAHVRVAVSAPQGISLGNLTHHATGGSVRAGVPSIVGDGGRPEVFVPDVNGVIMPSIGQFETQMSRGNFAGMRASGNLVPGTPGGMPQTLQLAATFVLPTGEVSHRQLITYALNTGRTPAQLFPDKSR